jgi:hypothetical protein
MGIEQHLMGLQRIGAQQKSSAVCQLDMRHLQFGALAAQNRKVFALVVSFHQVVHSGWIKETGVTTLQAFRSAPNEHP